MDERIQWLPKGVELPVLDYNLLARWIMAVAERYGRIVGSLTYMFCDDEEILRVNREFLTTVAASCCVATWSYRLIR